MLHFYKVIQAWAHASVISTYVSYWILFLFFVQLHSILSYFVFQFTHYGPAIFNIFIISSNRIVSPNSPVSHLRLQLVLNGGVTGLTLLFCLRVLQTELRHWS